MTTPSPASSPASEASRFERFCSLIGLDLEPFQRTITEAVFGDQRELVCLLPRGQGKTTLCGALALYHLLTEPRPAAYVAAASRDQARLLFEAARDFAAHPAIKGRVTARHLELRVRGGFLRVLAADAPKVHGLTPSLALVDELHAHRDEELYLALLTAMLKRPGAQMVVISTAGSALDSPLGRLRTRALALPNIERRGTYTDAAGPTLRMLEWAVPPDGDVDDPAVVKAANPASWITEQGLREQREAVQDTAFRRYHANQWIEGAQSWLPVGAWAACRDPAPVPADAPVWLGVDIGGTRATSAIVGVTEDLRVALVEVYTGEASVLDVTDAVRRIAAARRVREVIYDPWRFQGEALRLEAEGIGPCVQFPQSHARLVPASERLHSAIIEKRLLHPGDSTLNAHVSAAVALPTGRGWRLSSASSRTPIDGCISLAMAVERVENRPEPAQFHGWVS